MRCPESVEQVIAVPSPMLSATRVELAFAIIPTTSEGKISRFQMLKDSFTVSRAARYRPEGMS